MPASNSTPPNPQRLRSGVKSVAYCHGFMAGLKHSLDDDLILDVLTPVFGDTQATANAEAGMNSAALFMAGLFDGVSEYRRLVADPVLYSNWTEFMTIVETLITGAVIVCPTEGKHV